MTAVGAQPTADASGPDHPDATAPRPWSPGRVDPTGVLPVAGALLATVLAALGGLWLTGATAPSLLYDPGVLVRWGVPLVTAIGDLAAALAIGVLVLTAVALPVGVPATGHGGQGPTRAGRVRAYPAAMRLAGLAAGVWTVCTVVHAVLSFSLISGTPLGDPHFGSQLGAYLGNSDPGRGYLVTGAVAATVTMVAAGAGTLGTAGFLGLVAMIGLIPPALAGHAAGTSDHETAVTSLGLHLLGACIWVGGLAGLVLLRGRLGSALPAAVRRYSTLAGWAFVLVAGSGVVNAVIRVPRPAGLATSYGAVLLGKVGALGVLGVAGAMHRRRSLPDLDAGRPGVFGRLAAVEAVVMGVAIGLAAALAASAPPTTGPRPLPTLAQSVSGYPLPPPLTGSRYLTEWQPDLFWLVFAGLAVVLYLVGVRRLRRRGDHWSVLTTISWLVGVLALVYVTSGPPAVYGRLLFSIHMLGHMGLSMLVPIFLVMGAPITLALRALPARTDGSRGPREWLIVTVESRYARILSFPPVAAFLFAGSLVFFYFSPLFGLALRTHVGHELMHVHFLFAGYLFAWVLIGPDPGPDRVSQPLRLITLLAAMAFHAFFGVALLSGSTVLAADYFGRLGRTWGPALLADQRAGGGIAWGIGDIPAIAMAVILAIQWSRADEREARRRDRAADRDGDSELVAYNAMLATLAGPDQPDRPDAANPPARAGRNPDDAEVEP
jgi:putative copper resistance protein D